MGGLGAVRGVGAPYGFGSHPGTWFGGAGFLRASRCPTQLQNFWRAGARIGAFNPLRSSSAPDQSRNFL